MNPTNRFALETHAGPYESWPSRTRLVVDGEPSELTIGGYVLLYQFETTAGYLLATDQDCPFEESVTFTLLSKDLREVLSERMVGAMYASYWLTDIRWKDERTFIATFDGVSGGWEFRIRSWSFPVIFPRLKKTYIATVQEPV
ncbi:hypothetical protein [Paraburkholderia adhaesiva]|uniref:hypothetical protein n=1 Tax=Paraburkholderia adhaesiva TaxID=2883244 RepID=UPI001F22A10D|nr:hypothetical protein [Paraburkholderia adhaesiva]